MNNENLPPLNIANPVEFAAQEYLCAMQYLDDMKIIRRDKRKLSLVGRIKRLILRKQTDIEKLKSILDNQAETQDWPKIKYTIIEADGPAPIIRVEDRKLMIGFRFTHKGQFVGIFSWK